MHIQICSAFTFIIVYLRENDIIALSYVIHKINERKVTLIRCLLDSAMFTFLFQIIHQQ